jgi:hypothetical protein
MFPRAPAKEPAADPPAAAAACSWAPKRGAPGPVAVVVQFCANAPELVEITTAKANPARTPPSRAFNLRFMETAPEFQFSKKSNFRHFVRETRTRWKFVKRVAHPARHDFRSLCHKGNIIAGPTPRLIAAADQGFAFSRKSRDVRHISAAGFGLWWCIGIRGTRGIEQRMPMMLRRR